MMCPLCQHEGISEIHLACPVCGAELTPFRIIEELDEQYREVLKQRVALEGELAVANKATAAYRGKSGRYLLAFGLMAALTAWLWIYKQRPIVQKVQTIVQTDSLNYYREELAAYRQRSPREIKYVIKDKDVLEDLGELFYNSMTAGYRIGRDNGIETRQERRRLNPGDTLVIRFW